MIIFLKTLLHFKNDNVALRPLHARVSRLEAGVWPTGLSGPVAPPGPPTSILCVGLPPSPSAARIAPAAGSRSALSGVPTWSLGVNAPGSRESGPGETVNLVV